MPKSRVDSPTVGDSLTMVDLEMIFDAVKGRQKNFPEEPAAISFWFVLSGIGERFRTVECEEKEWSGLKQDIPEGDGPPTCPNGHALTPGKGMTIGWVEVE